MRSLQISGLGCEHKHGLAQQFGVVSSRRINIGFAHCLGRSARNPGCEESGHIEFLPSRKIVEKQYCDFLYRTSCPFRKCGEYESRARKHHALLVKTANAQLRLNGSSWNVLPVAAKTALATAAPTGTTPGSPAPVGAASDATICTSTSGISSIR